MIVAARPAGDSPSVRYNAHKLTILRALLLKLDVAVTLGKERMVPSNSDIGACMKLGAALTNENIAGNHFLAAIHFDA